MFSLFSGHGSQELQQVRAHKDPVGANLNGGNLAGMGHFRSILWCTAKQCSAFNDVEGFLWGEMHSDSPGDVGYLGFLAVRAQTCIQVA